MKKAVVLLTALIFISLSCKKEYKFYAFYMNKTIEITYPASGETAFDVSSTIVDIHAENTLEQEGTSADLVEEIIIEEIDIVPASDYNFNTLELFISSEGVTEKSLAKTNEGEYSLILSTENMDDFVKASKFTIRTVGEYEGSQSEATTVTYNLRFLVKTYVK